MLTSNRITNGTELNDLLGRLGLPGGLAGARFDQLRGDRSGMLSNLRDAWVEARTGQATIGTGCRTYACMGPASGMMPPQMPAPGSAAAMGYWDSTTDLAAGRPMDMNDPVRRRKAAFERRIMNDPGLRARLERRLGGQIILDGRADGVLRVRRGSPGPMPITPQVGFGSGGVGGGLASMDRGILDQLRNMVGMGAGAGPDAGYSNYLLGGLNQALGPQGTTQSGASDASSVLSDPSLTVEDKVMLVLMLLMRKMDEEIEGQTNRLTQLQQGGARGTAGGNSAAPSIDLETKKLERLVTKRQQMFDTLRHIMEKYDQTAKGVIDSIGR